MSMNISSNYGSYPPIINSSQLSDMKTALQVQKKIAETEKKYPNSNSHCGKWRQRTNCRHQYLEFQGRTPKKPPQNGGFS